MNAEQVKKSVLDLAEYVTIAIVEERFIVGAIGEYGVDLIIDSTFSIKIWRGSSANNCVMYNDSDFIVPLSMKQKTSIRKIVNALIVNNVDVDALEKELNTITDNKSKENKRAKEIRAMLKKELKCQ